MRRERTVFPGALFLGETHPPGDRRWTQKWNIFEQSLHPRAPKFNVEVATGQGGKKLFSAWASVNIELGGTGGCAKLPKMFHFCFHLPYVSMCSGCLFVSFLLFLSPLHSLSVSPLVIHVRVKEGARPRSCTSFGQRHRPPPKRGKALACGCAS